ncbi:Arc family DNA-binding protein [Diaphorobacter nitroreducens]|uniref:Arc family DNA-binding protein n=1 Tax=Diaphorobacter nitroreducens TaxID=164759 RepID=UPI003C75E66E
MRIPAELKEKLDAAAEENRRSMTAEVVARLQATFDETVVTTVEARVKPGAEEKRFEFNADEIADRVVERLENRERNAAGKAILRSGNVEPTSPISIDAIEQLYMRVLRALGEPSVIEHPRGNEPYGPQKSSNAKRQLPKRTK